LTTLSLLEGDLVLGHIAYVPFNSCLVCCAFDILIGLILVPPPYHCTAVAFLHSFFTFSTNQTKVNLRLFTASLLSLCQSLILSLLSLKRRVLVSVLLLIVAVACVYFSLADKCLGIEGLACLRL